VHSAIVLLLAGAAALAACYAGRALLAAASRRRERRFLELAAVVADCLAIRDDAALAAALTARIAPVIGADAVTLRLVRGHGLDVLGSYGDGSLADRDRLTLGTGAPGWVWATGEPSVVDDLLTHPASRPHEAPVRSGIYLPGHVDGQVVVVLAAESRRRSAFGPDHVRLLSPVVTLVATALRCRDLLREAERFEDRLLTLVGHEMRTPLTSVIGTFTTLISKSDRIDDTLRRSLEMLGLRAGRRLERVVQTMLMAAQLERGLITFERTPVDVADVVAEAVRHAGGDEVTAVVPSGLVVLATSHHLSTALQHLIDNALLHGAPPVGIATSVYGGHLTVEVRDNGRGIPEDALQEVLGRFRRDDDTVLTRPGSGLGLYVTRRLVDGMGGELEIWSEPGAGCRASIRLPLHAAPAAAAAQEVSHPVDEEAATAHPG
jgi:two-component system sensor histidine kinase KdpD